jgi:CRISPR/Cas system Type II protein with McrA/HNH and RuvC-like nuclease domain
MSIEDDIRQHKQFEKKATKFYEQQFYKIAWQLLLKRIENKTTWGKNELKQLMLECLIDQTN